MKLFAPHLADFYKTGHNRQYPDGTTEVYSNWTCRSDKHAKVLADFDHRPVFFGLQGVCQWLLIDLWNKSFFSQPWSRVERKLKTRMDGALGQGAVSTKHWEALHKLGYLPVCIKALPEGSRVPVRVPMWTIRNTQPEFFWVTNYLETQLSAELWKAMTSATTAFEYRRLFERYAKMTGAPKEFIDWQGHDFSMRGMSGVHDATQSGAAHLLSFKGTDTISAIDYLEDYYSGNETFVGGSVPATEHSVMCAMGQTGEFELYKRLISEVYPSGIVSIVSDTWDFWKVITEYAPALKHIIMDRHRDTNGNAKVVFRPDSGDPVKILTGNPYATFNSPEWKGAVECLWDAFRGTLTSTGHRLLDSHVGLIYGDSINLECAETILSILYNKGFASANVVFGIGSFTYQMATRDTFGTAIKATNLVCDGKEFCMSKKPKTDDGMKYSARGLLRIGADSDRGFALHEDQSRELEEKGLLETVFEDGIMRRHETLTTIRQRLLEQIY